MKKNTPWLRSPNTLPLHTLAWGIASIFALTLPTPASAGGISDWIDGTGDWGSPGNWNPGAVPNSGQTVTINQGNPTITVGENFAVNELEMGNNANSTSTLTISGGGKLTAGSIFMALFPTGTATINVSGVGSNLTVTNQLTVDAGGTGAVNVLNGASLTTGSVNFAALLTTQGSIDVAGTGSVWTASGAIRVGQSGPAFLTIERGGQLIQTGGNITVGRVNVVPGIIQSQIQPQAQPQIPASAVGTITIGLSPINLTFPNQGSLVPIITSGQFTISQGILLIENDYTPRLGDTATLVEAAQGVSGTFSNVGDNSFINMWRVTYGQNDIFATYSGTSQLETIPGLTPNERHLAFSLDRLIANGDLGNLGSSLTNLSNSELKGALDQLSALKLENFASSTGFNNTSFVTQFFDDYLANHRGADGTFVSSNGGIDYSGLTVNDPDYLPGLQQVHSRLLAWNPAPSTGLLSDMADSNLGGVDLKDMKSCRACEEQNPWNVFVSGDVVLAQDFSDSSAGLSHVDSTTAGMQVGADYRLPPNFLVGAMFGYGHTDATLDTLGSKSSVDTYSPGVYASFAKNGWYANALGSYGFADYDQDRNVSIGAVNGTAHSSPSGDQIVGNLDGGYDFHHKGWTFGPTVGIQYVHLDVDGFTETGLPGADLDVNQNESDSLRSRLGGRVAYVWQTQGLVFTPHFDASWQHEFLDQSRGVTSQFDGVGAGSFEVNTANPSRDSALLDTGLDAQVNKMLTVFADYTVQAGQDNYFGQSVQAGVKIGF
jgi:T5SS/PEP-CTERM-associated repeat protein